MSTIELKDTEQEGLAKRNYLGGSPLHELLSIYSYYEDGNYFHTEDGRFARIWRLPLGDMSAREQGDYYAYSNALSNVLTQWPHNSTGQIIRFAHTDIRERLEAYKNDITSGSNDFSKALVDSVVDQQFKASLHPKGFFQAVKEEDIDKATSLISSEIDNAERRDSLLKNIEIESNEGGRPFNHELYLILLFETDTSTSEMIKDATKKSMAALGLIESSDVLADAYLKQQKEFNEAVHEIEQTMAASQLPVQIVTGQGVVDLLYRIINPVRKYYVGSPKFTGSPYPIDMLENPESYDCENISHKVGFSNIKRSRKGWELNYDNNKYFYQVTSLTERPERYYPGILQAALGHEELENMICINFAATSPVTQWARLKIREQMLGTKENLGIGSPEVRKKQREDLNAVKHLTSPENITSRQSMIDASIHIITMGEDEDEVTKAAARQQRLFQNRGHHESTRADAVIHSCLPFNFRRSTHDVIKRSVPYMSSSLCDMIPFFTTYQGVEEPKILVNNRTGLPVFIDLWSSKVNTGHSLIAGSTGTGKSFAFNNFLMACIAKYRPKVWIVDKGRSYETLTGVIDGNYIELVQEPTYSEHLGRTINPTCLNPFYTDCLKDSDVRRMPTMDEITFLTTLLSSMIQSATKMGADKTEMPGIWINLISQSLEKFYKESYKNNPTTELTFSDYIPYLKATTFTTVTGTEIAEALLMYYGGGPFSAIFDGKLDVDWDNDFTVLETDKMATSPCLGVVLLALFKQIDIYSKFKLERHVKKIVAVDEAWATLSDPMAASALAAFFRELRKYGGACLLISQSIKDFVTLVDAGGGGAEGGILDNTSHFFLLACSKSDYDIAKKYLDFSDEEISEWQSIASLPPYYGELFYRMKTKSNTFYSGVVRLWPSPMQRWVATSDPDDFKMREARIKELHTKGLSINKARFEAVVQLSKEKPHGANYAAA